MYAVFKFGAKQHRVSKGQSLRLEKLDVEIGTSVEFDEVFLVANEKEVVVGDPLVKGCRVVAKVIRHGRGDKVKIIKFRRRKHFRKQQGHRQWFTEVKIVRLMFNLEGL
ncbi:50S ribosomal protein L21 [Candidatus Photodesmus blepharus]|uniref:Large ribosomal subunit protein bL21 n=1 Tax=Candidatus Photodesmus blepharonis TaxID=1179155 RepID=A0A084CM21_9GAMM|nr:50S ribosomal protein L21 [Candidatus Photodesmus blepharus]KEY90850.1 50S ribosomal protein L21 [Candidatus Photodesmus blepharus]